MPPINFDGDHRAWEGGGDNRIEPLARAAPIAPDLAADYNESVSGRTQNRANGDPTKGTEHARQVFADLRGLFAFNLRGNFTSTSLLEQTL